MLSMFMHKFTKHRYAFFALLCAWIGAYLYGYGHRVMDELLLIIQMIPAALVFGWLILPMNMFRVITGTEPSQALVWPLIISYWGLMIPMQIAYFYARLNLILFVIVLVLLVSTHGCYQWVNSAA